MKYHELWSVGNSSKDSTRILPDEVTVAEVFRTADATDSPTGSMNYAKSTMVPTLPSATHFSDIRSVDDTDLSHLVSERQTLVQDMLWQYDSVWSGSLEQISTMEHRIDLQPETRPFMVKPYRAGPPAAREEVAK